jgi:hypothetical protein
MLAAVLAAAGCATFVHPSEHGDADAAGRVLIALRGTTFKRAVALRLVEELQPDGCYVKVVDVSALGLEPAEDYDAIVVLDHVYNEALSKDVGAFLKFAPDRSKVILVATARDEYWKYREIEVDAVTAPSSKGGVDGITVMLLEKIRNRLQGR